MGGRRITQEQHDEIVKRYESGESIALIARSMGISPYAVRTHASELMKPTNDSLPHEPGEEWVDINGCDGRYKISSHGRVFATGLHGGRRKLLKLYGSKNGYDFVLLQSGTSKKFYVHRLVAEHFCDGMSDDNSEVFHIDGNLKNNHASNLSWCNHGDVSSHVKWRHDAEAGNLTDKHVAVARSMYYFGESVADIARSMGVSYYAMLNVLDGAKRFDDVDLLSMPGEVWKPVDGYDGKYFVSSYGRVFSTGGKTRKGGLVHICTAKNGYQSVALSGSGGRKSMPLHRLVALHFCDGHDEINNVVNHIDGNPSNNRSENLEWCTQSYNIRHAIDVLGRDIGSGHPCSEETKKSLSATMTGRRGPTRMFTDDEIRAIRSDHRSSTQLAKAIGVNKSTIQRIRNRESYSYVD